LGELIRISRQMVGAALEVWGSTGARHALGFG
jgi:hypothetical protein